ncbi:GPP34 family phosphoprotein [Streptomyces sp. NPDC056169]|uniref:GOLPH3/VPS74 family protein n=1 Tax=Streptomyces sp. NPDC056169 TaxID=3345734 RepID=UPI0035D5B4FC
MTTAKDLFIIAIGRPRPDHVVGQGDLSLALAGAELIDLISAGAITLDGDHIVPGGPPTLDDPLLGEAAAQLTRQAPYERIEDWLWRRGRDLSTVYQTTLEEAGDLTRKRSSRLSFGSGSMETVDTPSSRRAADRWDEEEPVLAALASVVGIGDGRSDDEPDLADEAVTNVVATVHDAVMELEAVRQRRTIENAAFANLWRG